METLRQRASKEGFMGFSACRKCNKAFIGFDPLRARKGDRAVTDQCVSVTVTAAVSNSSSISFSLSLSLSLIHSRPTHSGLPFNVHHHGRCSQTAAIFFFLSCFSHFPTNVLEILLATTS